MGAVKIVADLLTSAKNLRCRRYAILAVWVLVVAALAVICVRHSGVESYLSRYQPRVLTTSPPENQLNGLTYYRYDPNTNKLCFAARVGTLKAENATLGIFKTAAARAIKVKDLQLHFYEHSGIAAPAALRAIVLPEETAAGENRLGGILRQLADARDRWGVDIDLSNTIEVTIDNLDCRMFDDGALRLAVQCRRAVVDSGWPLVTLRGHVTITSADGSTLESNYVKWDTKRQSFTADGMYILRRAGAQIAGKGIRVDSNLNITNVKNAKL
jgi:hypothetical protein